MLAAASAHAHPHGWIDIQTRLLLDDVGRLTAIEQAWLFDELYSAFILEEFDQEGISVEQGLLELAQADIAALREYDYFTTIEVDGVARPLGTVELFSNGVAAERIWLKFELPLAEPLALAAGSLRYAVYDPTYFIEIAHAGEPGVSFAGPGAEACTAELVPPAPPSEIVSFAAALDRTESGGDGLGGYFAEWVVVECG